MTSPLAPQSELQCPSCGNRFWIDTIKLLTSTTVCPFCLIPPNRTGRFTNPAYLDTISEREGSHQVHAPEHDYALTGLDLLTRHSILDGGMSAL